MRKMEESLNTAIKKEREHIIDNGCAWVEQWVEKAFEHGLSISQIEKDLDDLNMKQLQIAGYKKLTSMLSRMLIIELDKE